ncbi:putative F-box protein [Arabidopsis thaliana]
MDGVSSLPNELLCHILSFLTTKEAALTSILSKRWRNLIAFVPNLYIDDTVFLHPEEGKRDRPEIIQSFMDFVDRILALQGNYPIKKCSLKCLTEVDSVRVDAWISNVLARGVTDLDLLIILDCESDDNYRLSPKCLQSSTLVSLKIDGGIDIGWVAGTVFLPMLKTLSLDSARVDNFDILLLALPALEELALVDVIWKDEDDYPLVNMKNLFDARIIFMLQLPGAREPDDDHWFDQNVALRYSNVLSLYCESMPVFKNLKSLAIKSGKERGWQAIPVLLRNCPHLETLVIEGVLHNVTDKCGDACDCISREDKGRSLTSCPVKMLEIRGFRGTMKEMTMMKHFLDYFLCLKAMNIYVEENDPTELRFPEVSKCIMQMMEEYNKLSSCNVELLVTDYFSEKWTAKGRIL